MKVSRRIFTLTALASFLSTCFGSILGVFSQRSVRALDAVDADIAGPMVGSTTPTTAAIWIYTPSDARVEVRLIGEAANSQNGEIEKISRAGLNLQGQTWRAHFSELRPDTQYEFAVAIDGRSAPEHCGSFRTAPMAGTPVKFRLGLTSCMKIEKPQQSWPLFLKQNPMLHLTLGDTVYADSTDPSVQWRHHLRYRQSPEFASVIRAMPTYAMWDDHDFGPNNSDGTAKGKEHSLDSWKRVWGNPDSGTADVPGAFYQFAWGDVEFFVVDGRYHRSPDKANDDAQKTMLGEAQFQWLFDGLRSSQAKFKLVASGSPLHHSLHDGWRVYTHARHQFFDAIGKYKIPGVVYLSGSLHQSLVWEHHESDRVGYPMVEVISSGIANSKRLGFATLDFDTTLRDPTMTVRIVQGSGKVTQQSTWALSQLSQQET